MRKSMGTLADAWYAAATGEQVTQKSPILRVMLGERIALWRNAAGKVVAHQDACSHRNAPLSLGKIEKNCLRCPYHGWTYDDEGHCTRVPSEGDDFARSEKRDLKTYPAHEAQGLVWLWFGEGEPDVEPYEMPIAPRPGFAHYYMETLFDNNVTNLVENFVDIPHTLPVHPGWFRNETGKRISAKVERDASGVLVTYDKPHDKIGYVDKLLNPKGEKMTHTDRFIMPNHTRVDYQFGDRHVIISSTCTPIASLQTRVFTLIAYKLGAANILGRILFPWYTRKVIEQDVDIMAKQGAVLRHQAPDFKHTPADTPHVFIEALREWGKDNSKPPPSSLSRDIEFNI